MEEEKNPVKQEPQKDPKLLCSVYVDLTKFSSIEDKMYFDAYMKKINSFNQLRKELFPTESADTSANSDSTMKLPGSADTSCNSERVARVVTMPADSSTDSDCLTQLVTMSADTSLNVGTENQLTDSGLTQLVTMSIDASPNLYCEKHFDKNQGKIKAFLTFIILLLSFFGN